MTHTDELTLCLRASVLPDISTGIPIGVKPIQLLTTGFTGRLIVAQEETAYKLNLDLLDAILQEAFGFESD